ncbi:hypothetical protein M3Y99_00572600 [Aphelenchoides fujianensis]|nr:hypothetical protein M3Y99_00572600 [Aphelenchoides fujianensis]
MESLVAKLDALQKEREREDAAAAATLGIPESKPKAPEAKSRPRPIEPPIPLLFVTQPTVPSSPMSHNTPTNVTWTIEEAESARIAAEEAEEEEEDCEEEEEEFEEEEYEEEDDGEEWEEEDEYDASLTISLSADANSGGLHPKDAANGRKRSLTPEFECDFDLPLMVAATVEPRKSLGGRTERLNILPPPPIFTASVTYDGQSEWDKEDESLEEEEEGEEGRDANGNLSVFLAPPTAYSSESEYDGNVDVGCTLSLVDRVALQDSDEYSTESEYESYYEDEYSDELTDEEEFSDAEMSASSLDAEIHIPLPPPQTHEPKAAQVEAGQAPIESNATMKTRSPSPLVSKDARPVAAVQPNSAALDRPEAAQEACGLEDKSALRKAPVNMTVEEQRRVEQQQQETDRQKARATGAVSAMRDRFRPASPPKAEPIMYKRSALLERKEEERPKRTYAVVKPVINDEFDKQMAELREQMKDKSSKLQSEYKSLSKGIHSQADDAKLRAKEEQHRALLGQATDTFSRADEERKKWQEQHVSDVERKRREQEERRRQAEEKRVAEEKAAAAAAAEPRKVTRRVRRIGDQKGEPKKAEPTAEARSNGAAAAVPSPKSSTASITPAIQKSSLSPEKKILSPTENKLDVPKRKRRHQSQKRRRFVRKPFDIDDLLGLSAFTDFEQMDDFFLCGIENRRPPGASEKRKKRRLGVQKIWISQLKDIDKLYHASELRDIKLDGLS